MITLDRHQVIIEDLEQILLLDENRVRCLLKEALVECFGSHFQVKVLSEHELILQGKCQNLQIHERK